MEELFKSLSESVSEECFNEILDMVRGLLNEDVHSAIDKDNEGSEYTKKGTPKSELHRAINQAQRSAEIQYAQEKGKPIGRQWSDETEFEQRRVGDDTKNAKGERKTYAKQFKGLGHISVYGDQPDEIDKEVRKESAKKHGRPVK